MSATPSEVEAAQKALGCYRSGDAFTVQFGLVHDCLHHGSIWNDRGCPIAVAVADAVVAVAERRIAADALRNAADVWSADEGVHDTWNQGSIAHSLRARADRIEAQP